MKNVSKAILDALDRNDIEENHAEALSEEINELKSLAENISSVLNQIETTEENVSVNCQEAKALFQKVREVYARLAEKVPKGKYYRFNFCWRTVTQSLVGHATYVRFLESGSFMDLESVAGVLGIAAKSSEGFHLDLFDYLVGLLGLPEKLVEFSMQCVVRGDYETPIKISKFIVELNEGYKCLNLKNDFLRKKYDSLKYTVQRSSDIVNDLKLYGQIAPSTETVNLDIS